MIVTAPGVILLILAGIAGAYSKTENPIARHRIIAYEIIIATGLLGAIWFVWTPITDLLNVFGADIINSYSYSFSGYFCQIPYTWMRIVLIVLIPVNLVSSIYLFATYKSNGETPIAAGDLHLNPNIYRWCELFLFALSTLWIFSLLPTWF